VSTQPDDFAARLARIVPPPPGWTEDDVRELDEMVKAAVERARNDHHLLTGADLIRHESVELDNETVHVIERWDAAEGRWVVASTYSGRILPPATA
jgi:hypothetical protein